MITYHLFLPYLRLNGNHMAIPVVEDVVAPLRHDVSEVCRQEGQKHSPIQLRVAPLGRIPVDHVLHVPTTREQQ